MTSIAGNNNNMGTAGGRNANAVPAADAYVAQSATTRPVQACPAHAGEATLSWWMGLVVVAVGVALGVLVSRSK